MRKHINWDSIVAAASWGIVAILFYGTVFILVHHLNPASPIVQALGSKLTRIVFVVLYAIQSGLLGYSKIANKPTLRRHTLMFIYLFGFFLSVLGFVLNGFNVRLLSNLLLSALAAVCWLYWRFKNKYLPAGITYKDLPIDSDYLRE